MTMTNINIDDLAQIIRQVDGNRDLGAGALAEAILDRLPAPTVIRTVEELEALDGPVWVTCRDSIPLAAGQLLRFIREYGPRHYLPAVLVVPAEQVRAAREALEEA